MELSLDKTELVITTQSGLSTNLTWANNAFAMTSNMDAKTRILILDCNSAESPLNNSKTLALAFAPASWYLNQKPECST